MSSAKHPKPAAAAAPDRERMAPVAAFMYASAALLVGVSLLLPQPPEINYLVIGSGAASGAVLAALIWLLRDRLSPPFFHVTTAAGAIIAGVCILYGGDPDTPYAWLFLWVAIFSAYFFTPAQTAAHLMLVGIVYAAAFALSPVEPDNPAAHWVVSLTVIALAAVVIHALVNARRRLEAEREELLAETIEQARTDALTGLPNRRAWLELLEHEVARAQRTGRPLCVAMLDLDHFKLFNDEHGHIAGDQLLAETAAEWSRVLRPTDTMARYGGEEFAVLLPECGLTHAIAVVQRLRATTARGQRCSAGLACWDGRESPMDLIARADARLYEAKEQGRDRVVPPDAEAVFAM